MNPDIIGILMGAVCGAVIGVEREWSGHASGPASHFAGIRTFTLLGGLAATAGLLWNQGLQTPALAILIGAIALIVAAYAAVSRRDTDGTTEVAALIVVTTGLLSGIGQWPLASGVIVVTALLLVEKSRLHSLVERISDVGLKAGFRFALMAVVILPLLPEGPYGPRGSIRPRELWILVLFFAGISYVAYVIRAILGPRKGYVWAGILGGLISSTNVTLTFSRLSRSETGSRTVLGVGVIAACTMLYLRVVVTASVLNPSLGLAVLPYTVLPALVGAGFTWYGMRNVSPDSKAEAGSTHPLQLRSALQMAALFQVVLFLTTLVRERYGDTGLIVSGAVLGFTDLDALVISMSRLHITGQQVGAAAVATIVGIISNTVLKLLLAAVIGQGGFRRLTVVGLAVLGVVTAASLTLF